MGQSKIVFCIFYYIKITMFIVTILLWLKAAQGLYINKDENMEELQSYSILQNFNSSLRNDKEPELPMMTLMSEPEGTSTKKKNLKKMILTKKRMMKKQALPSSMLHALESEDVMTMTLPETYKYIKTPSNGYDAEDESDTEDMGTHVVDVQFKPVDTESVRDETSLDASKDEVVAESDVDNESENDSASSDSDSSDDSSYSDSSNGDSSDSDSSDSDSSESSDSDSPDYYNGDDYVYKYEWYPHDEYVYSYEWAYTPSTTV